MHSYCSTLAIAEQTADDGTTILSSDGQEIIQDCTGAWGGSDLPFCGSCQTSTLGDINDDETANILDVVQIVSYVLGNTDFTESQECLSDVNEDNLVNILDIVVLVQSIVGG